MATEQGSFGFMEVGGRQSLHDMSASVQSVVTSQRNGPLIAAAAQLWICPGDEVLDVTYGRGLFWTHFRPANLRIHDLTSDGVDFRCLPEPNASVDVVVFDPPYICNGGRDTSTSQAMLDRYGLREGPQTVKALHALFTDGITEAHRVLRPKGRLFVKCMDHISGSRFVTSHHHVVSTALGLGMRQVDEFIHHSGTGPQSNHENQFHSRRAHSFLCIFQRPVRSP